ncbi:MAG TPA: hypothetical protein VIL20_04175 [Sandaracinaceae bacterium]
MSGRLECRLPCGSGVPPPRLIRPHATYAICRRIERRRFLLRPDAVLNELFLWVLAVTAAQFDVDVHIATVLSTHFHLVVTVPNENVSDFMHRLDMRLARALQVYRRFVNGVVWEPGKLSIVELETDDAVVEEIAYAMVNPVKAGLVYRAADWPGVTATPSDLGVRVFTASEPSFYFTAERWPGEASIQFTLPAFLRERVRVRVVRIIRPGEGKRVRVVRIIRPGEGKAGPTRR